MVSVTAILGSRKLVTSLGCLLMILGSHAHAADLGEVLNAARSHLLSIRSIQFEAGSLFNENEQDKAKSDSREGNYLYWEQEGAYREEAWKQDREVTIPRYMAAYDGERQGLFEAQTKTLILSRKSEAGSARAGIYNPATLPYMFLFPPEPKSIEEMRAANGRPLRKVADAVEKSRWDDMAGRGRITADTPEATIVEFDLQRATGALGRYRVSFSKEWDYYPTQIEWVEQGSTDTYVVTIEKLIRWSSVPGNDEAFLIPAVISLRATAHGQTASITHTMKPDTIKVNHSIPHSTFYIDSKLARTIWDEDIKHFIKSDRMARVAPNESLLRSAEPSTGHSDLMSNPGGLTSAQQAAGLSDPPIYVVAHAQETAPANWRYALWVGGGAFVLLLMVAGLAVVAGKRRAVSKDSA